jgi:hypothetical protein
MKVLLERNVLRAAPAAKKGDEEAVKMLLRRVDILCLGWETPLTTAVQGRHEAAPYKR